MKTDGEDMTSFIDRIAAVSTRAWEELDIYFAHSHIHCFLFRFRTKGPLFCMDPFRRYNPVTKRWERVNLRNMAFLLGNSGNWTGEYEKVLFYVS